MWKSSRSQRVLSLRPVCVSLSDFGIYCEVLSPVESSCVVWSTLLYVAVRQSMGGRTERCTSPYSVLTYTKNTPCACALYLLFGRFGFV